MLPLLSLPTWQSRSSSSLGLSMTSFSAVVQAPRGIVTPLLGNNSGLVRVHHRSNPRIFLCVNGIKKGSKSNAYLVSTKNSVYKKKKIDKEIEKIKRKIDPYYDLEDEAERLLKEIETTINEVQESDFYAELSKQMTDDVDFQGNLRRLLGSDQTHVKMVIYALGTIEFSFVAQYQLAIAMLLKREFSHWIGDVEVFDPALSPADTIVLEKLGCSVLTFDEKCRRQVDRPTLFFMPKAVNHHYVHLLQANWCPSRINNVILLSNRLSEITESYHEHQRLAKRLGRDPIYDPSYYVLVVQYLEAIQKYTRLIHVPKDFGNRQDVDVFHDFAWHFFDIEAHIDMDAWFPDKPSKKELKKLDFKPFNYLHVMKHAESWPYIGHVRKIPNQEDWSSLQRPGTIRIPRKYRCFASPPGPGGIQLKVSGKGYDESSPAGFGGIVYNSVEEPLAMYSGPFGEADTYVANVEALRYGLECLKRSLPMPCVKLLVVHSDNLSVMRWANGLPEPPARVREGLADIFKLLEEIPLPVVMFHIYEEANAEAIDLANKGAKDDDLCEWISKS